MKRILWAALLILFIFSFARAAEISKMPAIAPADRILILAPHPDDETIACAGIIQAAIDAGAQVRVVYLTNGEHNQFAFIVYEKRIPFRKNEFIHLGQVRRKEAVAAMRLLGLSQERLIFLGYPDFGTFSIFSRHWGDAGPYRDLLTRISAVPYKENFSYAAPYRGESILADLEKIMRQYQPTKIFVSHPADVNGDHKALYLFLQIALSDLNKDIPEPQVYPYLIHRVGWPLPRRYHPELPLLPPEKLPDLTTWLNYELTAEQLEKKHQAILCYRSQTESSAFYLLSFARRNELFSDCPLIQPREEEFLGDSELYTDSDVADASQLDDSSLGQAGVSYSVKESNLLIRIDKMRIRGSKMSFRFYLFGYSSKKPFREMPKIRIVVRGTKSKVWDAQKLLKPQGLLVESGNDWLVLTVPFKFLGEPDFVLASVKTYAAMLPVHTSAFRKISLKK